MYATVSALTSDTPRQQSGFNASPLSCFLGLLRRSSTHSSFAENEERRSLGRFRDDPHPMLQGLVICRPFVELIYPAPQPQVRFEHPAPEQQR
jgi:hypothetical protein